MNLLLGVFIQHKATPSAKKSRLPISDCRLMAPKQLFPKNTVISKTVEIAKTLLVSRERGTKALLAFITTCQIFNDTANLGNRTDGSHMLSY